MAHPHHPEHHVGHTPEMHDPPDEWHRHTAVEGRPQHAHGEVANPGVVMLVGLAAFVFVVIAGLAVYLYFVAYSIKLLEDRERIGLEGQVLAARKDATERLTRGYVWLDEEQGLVQLPLDVARRQVVAEYTAHFRGQE